MINLAILQQTEVLHCSLIYKKFHLIICFVEKTFLEVKTVRLGAEDTLQTKIKNPYIH